MFKTKLIIVMNYISQIFICIFLLIPREDFLIIYCCLCSTLYNFFASRRELSFHEKWKSSMSAKYSQIQTWVRAWWSTRSFFPAACFRKSSFNVLLSSRRHSKQSCGMRGFSRRHYGVNLGNHSRNRKIYRA